MGLHARLFGRTEAWTTWQCGISWASRLASMRPTVLSRYASDREVVARWAQRFPSSSDAVAVSRTASRQPNRELSVHITARSPSSRQIEGQAKRSGLVLLRSSTAGRFESRGSSVQAFRLRRLSPPALSAEQWPGEQCVIEGSGCLRLVAWACTLEGISGN